MLITAAPDESLSTLTKYCDENDIPWHKAEANTNWAGNRRFVIIKNEDFFRLKLIFGDKYLNVPWNSLEPDDDQEVKVMCHDCGGYVWSVSGFEWKEQEYLQRYRCRKSPGGVCQYE